LRLKFTDPIQQDYEVIRPVVLFSETITERSRQNGLERRRVGEKAQRFVQQGMLGLVDQRSGAGPEQEQEYPEGVAAHIIYLKQLYPPSNSHFGIKIRNCWSNNQTCVSVQENFQFRK
ncbi:MAG: hypothetical protein GY774_10405, partial [Planctomycetes bacterium]|nr:hypothetical protein [Planctomycetota bacterium]